MALGATEGQTHMAPGAIEGQTFMAPGATEGHTHMALGATDEQTLMGPGTTEGQTHMALGATDEQTLMGPGTTEGQTHMALGATEGQTLMALGATEGQTHMAPGAIEGQTHMATGAMAVQAHMAPGTNVLSGHRQTLSGIVTSKDYTHPPPGLTTSGYTTLSTSGGAPHIPSVVLTTSHPPAPETLTPGLPSVPHGVVTPAHASHIPGFTATGHLPMTPGVLTSGHTPVSQVIVAQHGTAAPGVMASGHGPSFTEVMATGHAPVSTGIIATGHAPSSAGLSTTQHILQPPLDTTMTVRSTQIPPGRYTANDGTTYVVMSDQQYYPEGQSAADVLNLDVVPGNPSKAEVSTVRRMLRRIKAIERRKGWNELSYLRVGFRDVIVEPEAMFTPKFLRLYTACLYSFLLSSVYAVFTFLLAPVLAVVYGITFAVVAFFNMWVFGPIFRTYKTVMAMVYFICRPLLLEGVRLPHHQEQREQQQEQQGSFHV
ncbi:uncharacterized protein [Panulirus ornatus]|uniref:uncharacterized protein isoform X2 n=1 Tax=Panulirus ornatus TaxID=150431 RepID=UPI003A83D250